MTKQKWTDAFIIKRIGITYITSVERINNDKWGTPRYKVTVIHDYHLQKNPSGANGHIFTIKGYGNEIAIAEEAVKLYEKWLVE